MATETVIPRRQLSFSRAPERAEKTNLQRRGTTNWGYQFIADPAGKGNWRELYRCTVCEEWMEEEARIHYTKIGMVHKDIECLREAAGLAPATRC